MKAIGPSTRVYALIGSPVRHSHSPALHNRWFEQHDIDAVYVAFDVDPTKGGQLVEALATLGLAGVNLTTPFKASVLAHVPRRSPLVDQIGAANVLVPMDGAWTAHNTDAEGWALAIEAEFGPVLRAGFSVLVLGAGGAGRAVAAAARGRGAAVTVLDRRFPERGNAALSAFAWVAPGADLIVDCTTGSPEVDALDLSILRDQAIWCDVNYWRDPPALQRARARGLRVQDGRAMLVHQAALSFALFTGVTPDPTPISDQLR